MTRLYTGKKVTPETELKHACKDLLDRIGVWNWPVFQGLGAHKGAPDRLAARDGITYALEFKRPKGILSEHQLRFKQECEAAGWVYLEIRSLEDMVRGMGIKGVLLG